MLSTAESEHISITKGAAHALEIRSAMVEYGLTFKAACEADASAGRPSVRHLDARLLWLQQLCSRRRGSSSSQAWRPQRGRPGNKDGLFFIVSVRSICLAGMNERSRPLEKKKTRDIGNLRRRKNIRCR